MLLSLGGFVLFLGVGIVIPNFCLRGCGRAAFLSDFGACFDLLVQTGGERACSDSASQQYFSKEERVGVLRDPFRPDTRPLFGK